MDFETSPLFVLIPKKLIVKTFRQLDLDYSLDIFAENLQKLG